MKGHDACFTAIKKFNSAFSISLPWAANGVKRERVSLNFCLAGKTAERREQTKSLPSLPSIAALHFWNSTENLVLRIRACLSRISDSGSKFHHPWSKVKKAPDPGFRSATKKPSIFNPKFSYWALVTMIRDIILHLGSRIQGSKRHWSRIRIRYTGNAHKKTTRCRKKIFSRKEPGAFSTTYVPVYNQPCIPLEKLEIGVLSIQDLRYISSAHTDRLSDNIGFLSCILHS